MTEVGYCEEGKTMEEIAFARRLKMFCALNYFEFGSLWTVGENLWKQSLPDAYVQRGNRAGHPGICLQKKMEDTGIHAAVPMWHGTTPCGRDEQKIAQGKRFVVKNFYNGDTESDKKHRTMFGHFGAVPIALSHVGTRPILDNDFAEGRETRTKQALARMEEERHQKLKDRVVFNDSGRKLSENEMSRLRDFTRRFLSL